MSDDRSDSLVPPTPSEGREGGVKDKLVLERQHSQLDPSDFPVDETPTPTKILKMADEVGLFHDLRENPFDAHFRKAAEAVKLGIIYLTVVFLTPINFFRQGPTG